MSQILERLAPLDLGIILGYLLLSLLIGILHTRRASRGLEAYFLSGRALPWWLAGTSMVATTFAADTPLAITEYLRNGGIWRNWTWWSIGLSQVAAVFLFAALWRRAGVLTDNELLEVRYSGRPAAFLRCFKAGYFALVYNFIVMGWVINAMVTVLEMTLGVAFWNGVFVCLAITAVYCLLSGIYGVVWTDLFQFGLAMAGALIFAVRALSGAGGLEEALRAAEASPVTRPETLRFFPLPGMEGAGGGSPFGMVLIYLLVLSWANFSADGGSYVIQRMMACRDERHAALATLWYAVAHNALRVWPWILVGIVSLSALPQLPADQAKKAYAMLIPVTMPAGLFGLMIATFLAAFMSTITTHLNWGASYLVNDVYRRFLVRDAAPRHYVLVSRLLLVPVAAGAGVIASQIGRITDQWELIFAMGSGVASVLIARWFWWRVNAWSEIAAFAASLGLSVFFYTTPLRGGETLPFHERLLWIAPGSTLVWVAVTLLTRPESLERLRAFHRRVRPGGAWRPVTAADGPAPDRVLRWSLAGKLLAGWALVFGTLFGIGNLLFGRPAAGTGLLLLAAAGLAVVLRALRAPRGG